MIEQLFDLSILYVHHLDELLYTYYCVALYVAASLGPRNATFDGHIKKYVMRSSSTVSVVNVNM